MQSESLCHGTPPLRMPSAVESLRDVAVCTPSCRLTDTALRWITALLLTAPRCQRLALHLTMNGITVTGLHHLSETVGGLHDLTDVSLDIRGNWMRGVEYGEALSVFVRAIRSSLRTLHLAFGGWGVRKQFGLQHLAALSECVHLRELSLCVTGARITSDSFRRVVSGVVRLPNLQQ